MVVGLVVLYVIVAIFLVKQKAKSIVGNLENYFYREFSQELNSEPDNFQRLWQAVKISLEDTIKSEGLSAFPVLSQFSKGTLKLAGTAHTQKLVDQLRGMLLAF